MLSFLECGEIRHSTRGDTNAGVIDVPTTGDSFQDCCEQCADLERCTWFSFHDGNTTELSLCLLFGGTFDISDRLGQSPGWTSAAGEEIC